jgi:hypothetical protein
MVSVLNGLRKSCRNRQVYSHSPDLLCIPVKPLGNYGRENTTLGAGGLSDNVFTVGSSGFIFEAGLMTYLALQPLFGILN